MSESRSPSYSPPTHQITSPPSPIPVEIVTEEEMSLIEAAYAAASAVSSSPLRRNLNVKTIQSITLLSKRRLSTCTVTGSSVCDIEDSVPVVASATTSPQPKRNRKPESLLHRFRRRRGLSVTDITATEWCEKQMEFSLQFGKPEPTKAMKAGSARHVILEEEVIKRVQVSVESAEDAWAIKFLNFIVGTNQLLCDGLTRELPLVGIAEGVWIVGVVDEIRMPMARSERCPTLIDTKTRTEAMLPSASQRRNGRLQLMCYKHIWDNLVSADFPAQQFFDFFSLNPNHILSKDIRESTEKSSFPAETLNDMLRYFRNCCSMLPPAHDQLLLRYELQEDHSLLGEDKFAYNPDWLKLQIKQCLEVWQGEREANFTTEEERWKCKFCKFASVCQVNSNLHGSSSEG